MPAHATNLSRVRKFLSVLGLSLLMPVVGWGELVVDEDVVQLMLDQPDVQHPLILTVALTRAPLDLQALLPTVDELNTCTAKCRAWEELVRRKAAGEAVSDAEISACLEAAEAYDAAVRDKRESASLAYELDYASIVAGSVPPALNLLQAKFGEKVVWRDQQSQMVMGRLAIKDLTELLELPGIDRVSYNLPFGPMLDTSRFDVRADWLHAGDHGVGPYTGAGVRVAVVDEGVCAEADGDPEPEPHPRLPFPPVEDQCDFTDRPEDPWDLCSGPHGTWVAGIVFTEYDGGDLLRGIAAWGPDAFSQFREGASLINARVYRIPGSWPLVDCGQPWDETWAGSDWPAFGWAARSALGAAARIINFSRGATLLPPAHDTSAGDLTSLNVDWLVYVYGVCFIHSCGNNPPAEDLSPPSGAYNCFSIGAYDEWDTPDRADNRIWLKTSPGPTSDPYGRRKPDMCAPGVSITTTIGTSGIISGLAGTSFAAPHVAATCAMLLEARPSLEPRQIHAILIATTDFGRLPDGSPQTNWDPQGGWGMLHAYRAVQCRNNLADVGLTVGEAEIYNLARPGPEEQVVVACAWQRRMTYETIPWRGSPGKLTLRLDRRPVQGGEWELGQTQQEEALNNAHRVWSVQGPQGGQQYDFRVCVQRIDSSPHLAEEICTLASRHAFAP